MTIFYILDFTHFCRHVSIYTLEIEFAVRFHFQAARWIL